MNYVMTIFVAYLIGSIPFGFLVAKGYGVDIRKVGSGNIGATNVFRSIGKGPGVAVFILDALKGWMGCLAGPWAAAHWGEGSGGVEAAIYLPMAGGLFAFLGHNFPIWLKFRGGKGIATAAGVLLALLADSCGISVLVWGTVTLVTRYVSLGSIGAALALPVATWAFGHPWPWIVFSGLLSAVAIFRHRSNIVRLYHGTEHRFGKKNTSESSESSRAV